jgi:hypothetical protein
MPMMINRNHSPPVIDISSKIVNYRPVNMVKQTPKISSVGLALISYIMHACIMCVASMYMGRHVHSLHCKISHWEYEISVVGLS